MTMADILAAISGLLIVGLGFPALFIILTLIFPSAVEQASKQISIKPLRLIARGLFIFLTIFFLSAVLAHLPVGITKLFALLLVLAGLCLTMIGGAGLANQMAIRYQALSGSTRLARNLFCSALLIEMSIVLPLIGWFVILPVTLLLMLGAGSEILFRPGSKAQPLNATQPVVNLS